jgi:hypothetical protein
MRCSLRARTALLLALAALAVTNVGCSGAALPPADFAARAAADAAAQLKGSWTLQSFRPEVSLEPMLQAMLDFQFGRLTAVFDGQRMVADSVGIHVDRAYQISEARGDQFKMTSFDDKGVPYEAICSFNEGKLMVHSTTDPWRGFATLTRSVSALPAMPGMPAAAR